MVYKVELVRPVRPDYDLYEKDYDNLLLAQVYSKRKNISDDCRIILTFSKNGLVGFATELLRYATGWEKQEYREGSHSHLYPIMRGGTNSQNMGVFLEPGSSEVIFVCSDPDKTALELIEEAEKE